MHNVTHARGSAPAPDIGRYEAIAGIDHSDYHDRRNIGAVGGGMITGAAVEAAGLLGEKVMADRATDTGFARSAQHLPHGGAGEALLPPMRSAAP